VNSRELRRDLCKDVIPWGLGALWEGGRICKPSDYNYIRDHLADGHGDAAPLVGGRRTIYAGSLSTGG